MVDVQDPRREVLTARELKADSDFSSVPPKFLLWQQGLAFRWRLKPDSIMLALGGECRLGFRPHGRRHERAERVGGFEPDLRVAVAHRAGESLLE